MTALTMFLQNRRDIFRIRRRSHAPHLRIDNRRGTTCKT